MNRKSVLIVEDDAALAVLYSLKLRMDGYAVHHASNAFSAEVIFAAVKPDVVCVDTRLPDALGTDLAAGLVARGALVLVLTNDQLSYERPPAGVAGALLKSRTTPADLSRAIDEALSGTRTQRRRR